VLSTLLDELLGDVVARARSLRYGLHEATT
jgi:hypothetical protein